MRRETMKIVVIVGICAFLITLQEAYGNKSILPEGKIISGQPYESRFEKIPFIVSIRISGRHTYTAIILSGNAIFSSGDCASKVDEMYCKVDENNNSLVEIYYGPITDGIPVLKVSVMSVKLFNYYKFNDPSQSKKFLRDNYGLIYTVESFYEKYATKVTICLDNYGNPHKKTFEIVGWDSSISTKGVDDFPKVTAVKKASANVLQNDQCERIYHDMGYKLSTEDGYRCVSIQNGYQLTQGDIGSPVLDSSAFYHGIIVYVPVSDASLPCLMIYRSEFENLHFPRKPFQKLTR